MKKTFYKFFAIFSLLITTTGCVEFVDAFLEDDYYYEDSYYYDDNDNQDFLIPDDFPTIQQAIDYAIPGDRVFVRVGVYAPSTNGEIFPIFLKNGVDLIGEDPEDTILDAENTEGVFDIFRFDEGVLQGFTIFNGLAVNGGALFIDDSRGIIRNLYILGNRADNKGSGIYVKRSTDLILSNLVISNNTISPVGTGDPTQVQIEDSSILFINNVVAYGDSDGLRMNAGSSGFYENNIFYKNGFAGFGVGFADNNLTPTATIRYNLFFDNVENDFFIANALRTAEQANQLTPVDEVDFNFYDDPLFTDPLAEIFTLQPGSPAIHAGDPDPAFNNFAITRNDIGAYGGQRAILP